MATLQANSQVVEENNAVPNIVRRVVNNNLPRTPVGTPTSADLQDDMEVSRSGILLGNIMESIPVGLSSIQAWDNWLENKLNEQVKSRSEFIGANKDYYVKYHDVTLVPAYRTHYNNTMIFTPMNARHLKNTYFTEVRVHVTIYKGGTPDDPCSGEVVDQTEKPLAVGRIPCMLHSKACHLRGKTPDELIAMQEDPRDKGGYFIVDGLERTIFYTEMLRVNRFVIGLDTKVKPAEEFCAITADTVKGTVITTLRVAHPMSDIRESIIKLNISNIRSTAGKKRQYTTINVFAAIRLYAMLKLTDEATKGFFSNPYSIQAVILKFVKPERHSKLKTVLAQTLSNALTMSNEYNIMCDIVDLNPRNKNKLKNKNRNTEEFQTCVVHTLESFILSHEDSNNPIKKIYSLCMMVAHLSEYLAGYRSVTDKDSWEEKRLLTPSKRCEQLFRGLWKCFARDSLKKLIDSAKLPSNILRSITSNVPVKHVTDGFQASFSGPRWGVKTVNVPIDNPVQMLPNKTFMERVMMLSRINVEIDRKSKSFVIRSVQPTQWGFVDPSDSTESSAIGLVKGLSITCTITPGTPGDDVLEFVQGMRATVIDGVSVTKNYVSNSPGDENKTNIMVLNGFLTGWCNGSETRKALVAARREGIIDRKTCVVLDHHGYLLVHTDEGRLVRPVLIVNDNQELVLDQKKREGIDLWNASLEQLLSHQCIEYIDSLEQTFIRVAPLHEDLDAWRENVDQLNIKIDAERATLGLDPNSSAAAANLKRYQEDLAFELANKFTHADIHPQALFAPSLTQAPFKDRTQAPRISFQSQMGKQAMGTPSIGGQFRFDNDAKYLLRPTRPLVTQQLEDYQDLKRFPHGIPMTIVFLPFKGLTQEDAFIVKKEVVDYGYLDISHYFVVDEIIEEHEILMNPAIATDTKPNMLSKGDNPDKYKFLTKQGLPMINSPLKQGDYILGKVYKNPKTGDVRNTSRVLKIGEFGTIDTIHVVSSGRSTRILIKMRRDRSHQVGDKLSSRYAQKGTTSAIIPAKNLPFIEETGEVGEIYVNPHGTARRMTLGYIFEPLLGLISALTGRRFNSSGFEKYNMDEFYRILESFGFDSHGYRWMRHPDTGIRFKAKVFMGPIYMQVLYHLGPEKLQVRSSGVIKLLTHQPPRGTAFGGRRVGEMERNVLITHGAAHYMIDLLVNMSDAYDAAFCTNCGNFAIVMGGGINQVKCNACKDKGTFVKNTIPYVYKLLQQYMFGTGVHIYLDYNKVQHDKTDVINAALPAGLAQMLGNMEEDTTALTLEEDPELGMDEEDLGVDTGDEEEEGDGEMEITVDALMGDDEAGYVPEYAYDNDGFYDDDE